MSINDIKNMNNQKRKEKGLKMKKNLLKYVFWISFVSLFFMITLGIHSQVKAVDITYKAEYESPISYKLTITGLVEQPEKYDLYNAMICQETDITEKDFLPAFGKKFSINYNKQANIWEGTSLAQEDVKKAYSGFDKKGQYYVYVAAKVKDSINWVILDGPTKIDTPPLPSLTNRILIAPSYTSTSYSIKVNAVNTMMHNGVQRTIRFYIGEVKNEDLLKNLNENKKGAYEELLEYAKQQKPNLKESSFKDTKSDVLDYNIVANYPIENGKYYFIYSILDNENGTYNDVEDIEIYNGVKSSQGVRLDKFKYLGTETKPQNPNENSVNNVNTTNKNNTMATKPLPNAGSSMLTIVILIVTIICVIMLYVKNKEYKGIK